MYFSDISSEGFFFFFLGEINNVQSKTSRAAKRLSAKLPAGSVLCYKTTSQLDSFTSFLSNVLLWYRLTFDWRGSCLGVIFVEVVSDRFSQG